jgi:hypothetical protein
MEVLADTIEQNQSKILAEVNKHQEIATNIKLLIKTCEEELNKMPEDYFNNLTRIYSAGRESLRYIQDDHFYTWVNYIEVSKPWFGWFGVKIKIKDTFLSRDYDYKDYIVALRKKVGATTVNINNLDSKSIIKLSEMVKSLENDIVEDLKDTLKQ